MARQRYLSKAPITEALISFQLPQSREQFEARKQNFISAVSSDYYEKGPIATGMVQIDTDPSADGNLAGIRARTEHQIVGVRLHSRDEKYVAQVTLQGLTLSRLHPYEGWERLRDEMRRLWGLYDNRASDQITRVAVRYINTIYVPLQDPPVHFESVFLTPPKEPEGMPEGMSSFLSRCVIEDTGRTDCSIIVTIASRPPQDAQFPVLLDIEVVRGRTFDVSELWVFLEAMRDLKNRSFFGSLTEDTISKYE